MKKYREAILYTILIALIFITAIRKTYPEIVNIIHIEKSKSEKFSQAADLERKLNTFKIAEQEKKNLIGQVKKIYKPEVPDLDVESSFTTVFDDIIEMAKYNGIKIYSVEYIYNPPEDEVVKGSTGKYNVCKVNMEIIADYSDLENFLREIYKYPYLINLDKLQILPYQKNKKILLTTLEIKLYSAM